MMMMMTTMFLDLLLCLISELEGSGASAAFLLINCTLFLPTVERYELRSWGGLSLHYMLTNSEMLSSGSKAQIDQNSYTCSVIMSSEFFPLVLRKDDRLKTWNRISQSHVCAGFSVSAKNVVPKHGCCAEVYNTAEVATTCLV
jgi:hypothetical protein